MRVLIAYDGSEAADEACDLVATIDWPRGSELRVVTAYAPYLPGELEPVELFDPATPVIAFEAEREAAECCAGTAASRLGRPGITVTSTAIMGRPSSVILDQAAAAAADLLVTGCRGMGPITSALLGSVSAEIVDHAACPVLVARRSSIDRVVLADDGSAGARTAAALLAWPVFVGSRVRVVTVAAAIPLTPEGDLVEAVLDKAEAVAAGAAAELRTAGLAAETDVRAGDPAHEIVRSTVGWDADLIVMGKRGRTGLDRHLLGSVTRKVLAHATCSVLVARSPVR